MIDLNDQHRNALIKQTLKYMVALELFTFDPRAGATTDPHWETLAADVVDTFARNSTRDGNQELSAALDEYLADNQLFTGLAGRTLTIKRVWHGGSGDIEIGLTQTVKGSTLDALRFTALAMENQVFALYQAMPKPDSLNPNTAPKQSGARPNASEWCKLDEIAVRTSRDGKKKIVFFIGGKYKLGVACYDDSEAAEAFGIERFNKMELLHTYKGVGWFQAEKDSKGYNKVVAWKPDSATE